MANKRILVCPLDWGLGHATRDACLIIHLVNSGFKVVIGADKAPLFFLRQHFPSLPFIIMPSYSITYPNKGSLMVLKMLISLPKILFGIFKEHLLLKKILKSDLFDIVISDNRYGLWNKSVYSIFITHQLNVQTPKWLKWAEKAISSLNKWFINKYNDCWIPDYAGSINLAGILSHSKRTFGKTNYIGPLSRFSQLFTGQHLPFEIADEYEVLIILSGPEPQRSIFEKIVLSQLPGINLKSLVIQGNPLSNVYARMANICMVSHVKSEHLAQLIINTPIIISRSGYSTIMDLVSLQKNAIIIPTPGQTEQEYLAKYMFEQKWFFTVNQGDFEIKKAIDEFEKFLFRPLPQYKSDLSEILGKLV